MSDADLIVGCIYEGGRKEDGVKGKGGDELKELLKVNNSGGFRKRTIEGKKKILMLLLHYL